MRVKQKNRSAITAVLLIAALSLLLIGGALTYIYATTDATQVPDPAITLNEDTLSYVSANWYTPVFDGLVYKFHGVQADPIHQMPTVSEAMFVLRVPTAYTTQITVRDPLGNIITPAEQPGEFKYAAERNGVYSYEISLTMPKVAGGAYGDYRYTGRIEINVEPAIHFSSEVMQQGGVLTVLVTGMGDLPQPQMTQNISLAHFVKTGTDYAAVIGAGYNTTPGSYVIDVTCGDLRTTKTITVEPGEFERQDMTISGDIAASTNTAAAALEWRTAIWPLYETADDTIHWAGDFRIPLDKIELTTTYGLFRYTNGSSDAQRHAGIDLDGETGDIVYSPNGGRVAYAGFLTMTGNTVVIEHGAGLKSYFFHMDSLSCKTDDMVRTGDVIGAVGSTGYSTGPHLHYELKIGKQSINPMPLFDGTSSIYTVS